MSVIEERNAEILRPQLKLIAQGRSRELDLLPEVEEPGPRLIYDDI